MMGEKEIIQKMVLFMLWFKILMGKMKRILKDTKARRKMFTFPTKFIT